jgi:probable phosphoglycerate mutase
MELILVRHALPITRETEDGSPADPPLSDTGHGQASAMASWLASERIDRLYASPLRRAQQTALPLAERLGMEIETEPRVSEYDRDSAVYVPLEDLKKNDYAAWRDFMERGYPEGMDLEAFCREVVAGLEEIVAGNSGARVAVVCHGGVINIWASHVLGLELKLFFDPRYTSINRFMASGAGHRSVVSLNEVAHLRGL